MSKEVKGLLKLYEAMLIINTFDVDKASELVKISKALYENIPDAEKEIYQKKLVFVEKKVEEMGF